MRALADLVAVARRSLGAAGRSAGGATGGRVSEGADGCPPDSRAEGDLGGADCDVAAAALAGASAAAERLVRDGAVVAAAPPPASAASRRSISRRASCSCSSVSSMLVPHCQQSATISHKRTVMGAPQSGQPHISTSPTSHSVPPAACASSGSPGTSGGYPSPAASWNPAARSAKSAEERAPGAPRKSPAGESSSSGGSGASDKRSMTGNSGGNPRTYRPGGGFTPSSCPARSTIERLES